MPPMVGFDMQNRACLKSARSFLGNAFPTRGLPAPGAVPVEIAGKISRCASAGEGPGGLAPRERPAIRLVARLQDDRGPVDAGGVNEQLVGQVEARQDAKPVCDNVVVALRVEDRLVLVRVVLKRAHRTGAAAEHREARRRGIARGLEIAVGRAEETCARNVSPKLHDRDSRGALRRRDALLLVELPAHRRAEAVYRGDRGESDDHGHHQLDQGESAFSHA